MRVLSCQNCEFSDKHPDGSGALLCRRHAPLPSAEPTAAFWPAVLPDDWCGSGCFYQGAINGAKETSQCTSS